MAHYAFIDENNIVREVIVGIDENELVDGIAPEQWYSQFRNLVCKRTSYNGNIRKRFAGVGYSYDPIHDVFVNPQPYLSWTLDDNHDWQPPVPRPDGAGWMWDETIYQWIQVIE